MIFEDLICRTGEAFRLACGDIPHGQDANKVGPCFSDRAAPARTPSPLVLWRFSTG
jgi:hypothetical protein